MQSNSNIIFLCPLTYCYCTLSFKNQVCLLSVGWIKLARGHLELQNGGPKAHSLDCQTEHQIVT